ncbi:MAG: insulinase family protein [Puniceicoccales bacterium]|jgi:zinc protease|nr:insulinase family protein [Puniceicoccales bacterium]
MSLPISSEQLLGAEPLRRVLPNGLTVFFAPEYNAGLVSVQVWVKTGSIHEGDLLGSGLSHYLEHMVFKGTAKYSCRGLTQAVQRTGALMNAYTTFDRTVFHVDGPAEGAETAFDVLGEMTLRATISPEDTARERDVILREIDMRDDDPDSLLSETVLAEAFHVHPYSLPVIGLRHAFSQVTHAQLLAYYRARYVPNNMVLVVAGALAPETVFAFAQKYFGEAPASALGAPHVPEEPEQIAPRRRVLFADVQVLRGSMAWRIPGMRHVDAPALDVFSMLLGLGLSSRLHRRLHEELGLVHQIDASNWTPGQTGLFWLTYVADAGRRNAVEAAVCETVEKALREGFSEAEFAKARRACVMAFLESRKTVSGFAGQIGAQAVVVGDMGYPSLYLDRVQALTLDVVRDAARRHISPDKLTYVAMEPSSAEVPAKPETAVSSAPAPAPFEEVRLGNGLRVLLQPVRGYPKTHYRIVFHGGGYREPTNRRGLCAMLATLMARDTARRTAAQVAEAAETLGASLQETSGNNSFGLAIEVLRSDADAGRELLADAVLRPIFTEKTFSRERDVQRSSLQEDEDDVVEFGKRRLRELFFGAHPLAVDHLGREPDLNAMTVEEVRAHHAALVSPENGVLSVSGDFDREAVLSALEKDFGAWSSSAPAFVPPSRPDIEPAAGGRRVDETRSCEQAVVFMGFPDTGIACEDYVAGQLLDELLSGMASQLFVSVREERGLAYFIGANRVNTLRDGLFYLYAGTVPGQVEVVLEAMRAELARMRSGEFTEEEISSGKIRLKVARRMSAQTPGSRALNAALNALYGMEVNRDAWWEHKLDALDAAALAVFTQRYLREDAGLTYVLKPQ